MYFWFVVFIEFVVISLFPSSLVAQKPVLNYEHLTTKEGLANNFVTCIAKDEQGLMWFGTQDGLCRYDGYSYKIYKSDTDDNYLLFSNSITSLQITKDSLLYVGTTAGLHVLNPQEDIIYPIESFKNQYIYDIFMDSEQKVWVIATGRKIFVKASMEESWEALETKYPKTKDKSWVSIGEHTIKGQVYISLVEEERKEITDFKYTVYLLEEEKKTFFSVFSHTNTYLNAFHQNQLIVTECLNSAPAASFQIPTIETQYVKSSIKAEERLLYGFKAQKKDFYLYAPMREDVLVIDLNTLEVVYTIEIPLIHQAIKDIFLDEAGNLWIATFGSGVLIFPSYNLGVLRQYSYFSEQEPDGASVRTIYKDAERNTTWLGSYSKKKGIDIFVNDSAHTSLILGTYALSMEENKGNSDILWISSYDGLFKAQKHPPQLLKSYFTDLNLPTLVSINPDTLLFANARYIYVFDTKSEKIRNKIPAQKTTYLYQDRNKKLWVGAETKGFASLDLTTQKLTYHNPEAKTKTPSLHVKSIYQDTEGLFWIATTKGLYSFDEEEQTYNHFTTKEGLPNNVVYGILEDKQKRIWLSTNKGISCYNKKTNTFTNFDLDDGLQDNEYNTYSFYKSRTGELFFGGIEGVDAFFPEKMLQSRNKYAPKMILIKVKVGNTVLLQNPTSKVEEIRLPSDSAQLISFEFSALSYYQSKQNQYAYKIDEISDTWTELKESNELTLTNLSSGNYTLHIKGSNNHGVWTKENLEIRLHIIPPFWKRSWFLMACVAAFVLGVYSLFKVRIYQLRQREEQLEAQIQKRTKELYEANQSKNQLFAIIAHDIRSPLVAFEDISNQIEYFIKANKPHRLLELGKHIDNSSRNLNTLLNNLLNWALIQQNHQIQTSPQVVDLSEMVGNVVVLYENIAQSNRISLKNNVTKSSEVVVDIDSFQTILRNLLSNALKYTPSKGKVTISAIKRKESIVLIIEDTGIGMPEELIDSIFKPNNISSSRGLRGEKGTGLGLSLCQEFATINDIHISVKTTQGKGTTFHLDIPTPK